MKSFLTFGDKILSLSMKSRLKKDQETRIHHQIHNAWRVLPRTRVSNTLLSAVAYFSGRVVVVVVVESTVIHIVRI